MTPDQMETTIELVSVLWPNPRQDMQRLTAGYVLLLSNEPYAEVEGALRALSIRGREFPPPPGVVAQQVNKARSSASLRSVLEAHRARRLSA